MAGWRRCGAHCRKNALLQNGTARRTALQCSAVLLPRGHAACTQHTARSTLHAARCTRPDWGETRSKAECLCCVSLRVAARPQRALSHCVSFRPRATSLSLSLSHSRRTCPLSLARLRRALVHCVAGGACPRQCAAAFHTHPARCVCECPAAFNPAALSAHPALLLPFPSRGATACGAEQCQVQPGREPFDASLALPGSAFFRRNLAAISLCAATPRPSLNVAACKQATVTPRRFKIGALVTHMPGRA